MGRNTRAGQLRQDQLPVGNDLCQIAELNTPDQFLCTERPLPCGTPNIDAVGVQYQNPCIAGRKRLTKPVKAHLVIGGHEYAGLLIRISEGIQTGINREFHTSHTPTGLDTSEAIRPR